MDVRINKLYEIFLYAQDVGFDYPLVNSLRTSPKLKDFLSELDPEISLDATGYWPGQSFYGMTELRKQVIKSQGYRVSEDNILITAGTNEANFLIIMQTISPGDEMIIDMPSWPQPYELGRALGANVKFIKRRENLGWGIDLDELDSMVTAKTKLIFLCSPNNPTGAVFTPDEIKKVCKIADKNGSYLLCDEVYRGLEWDGKWSPPAVNYYEKAISTSSVSKTLGLQGLRTGWMATHDKKLLKKCLILREDTSEVMNTLGEHIALAALQPEKYQQLLKEGKEEGQRGWAIVKNWLSESKVFQWVEPSAGFLGFLKYNFDIKSEDFCKRLLAPPYRTFLLPGIAYDLESYMRIGVGGGNTDQILGGLCQIDNFVRDIRNTST